VRNGPHSLLRRKLRTLYQIDQLISAAVNGIPVTTLITHTVLVHRPPKPPNESAAPYGGKLSAVVGFNRVTGGFLEADLARLLKLRVGPPQPRSAECASAASRW
jgi:hypothetical protein